MKEKLESLRLVTIEALSMVQKICKICQQTWDFRGGRPLCSDICASRWELIRSRTYMVIVRPVREAVDRKSAEKDEQLANLHDGLELWDEFLNSDNPLQFIAEYLSPEDAARIGDGAE